MIRNCILLVAAFMLVGCKQEKITYQYLMQRPMLINAEYVKCQELKTKTDATDDQKQFCVLVNNAANDLRNYMQQLQENPERIGMQLLQLQTANADLKLQIDRAKQSSFSDSQQATKVLTLLKTNYDNNQIKINTLLAVVALYGPE